MSYNLEILFESILKECDCKKEAKKLSLTNVFINELKIAPISSGANEGCTYEKKVISVLNRSPIAGTIKKSDCRSTSVDADININGALYNVEIKSSPRAQMGGGTFSYDGKNTFAPTKENDGSTEEITDLIKQALLDNKADIDEMLFFLKNQKPQDVQNRIVGFPLVSTHTAWHLAQTKNKLVNLKVSANINWIRNFYTKKGVDYIQIGGAGLFYLSDNPANLPIPQLDGEVDLEIRTAANGARPRKYGKNKLTYLVAGGFLRVQARLRTSSSSPYSLDNPQSIQNMLSEMKSNNTEK